MLQCSKYKARRGVSGVTIGLTREQEFHATFTKRAPFSPRWYGGHVICGMGQHAGARDLRNLLSVAAKLRHLANDTLCRGDQSLYLMTAEALEKRAEWLAATLPQERSEHRHDPQMHTPVDVTI